MTFPSESWCGWLLCERVVSLCDYNIHLITLRVCGCSILLMSIIAVAFERITFVLGVQTALLFWNRNKHFEFDKCHSMSVVALKLNE